MHVLDQSLEFAIQDIVEELDPNAPDTQLLCDYAGCSLDGLADQLLELLGLPLDDVQRATARIAAKIGAPRVSAAIACIARLLEAKHVELEPEHLEVLGARPS